MGQMVKLPRTLRYVPFELGLVSAQLGFGAGNLCRHGIEGFSQRIDFCRTAAGCAGAAISSGLQFCCRSQAPHGHADARRPTSTDTISTTPRTAIPVLVSVCSAISAVAAARAAASMSPRRAGSCSCC